MTYELTCPHCQTESVQSHHEAIRIIDSQEQPTGGRYIYLSWECPHCEEEIEARYLFKRQHETKGAY